MGIYIPNMEMPKSCDVCPFVGTNDDLMSDDYRYLYCGFPYMGQYVTDYEATRHADCPLVPLPEGHGRLIDGDAVTQEAYRRLQECEKYGNEFEKPYEVIRAIETAKTIVPAEGGTDDGV